MKTRLQSLPLRRLIIYLPGLMIYAYGACLMARVNVGVSPVTSVSYIFTCFTPLSLGVTQLVFNVMMIGLQALWMGKQFDKLQYLQLATSVLFSIFIDLLMPFARLFDPLHMSMIARYGVFTLGMLGIAMGIALLKISDLMMLPADGFAKVVAFKLCWPFGKAKVLVDCACAATTCVISLLAMGRIEGIRIGTIVAALLLGNIARAIIYFAQEPLRRLVDTRR